MVDSYAFIKNGKVVNVALFETTADFDLFKKEFELDDIVRCTSHHAVVGAEYADGVFKSPSPMPSLIWDEELHEWIPPVPYPKDGKKYTWDEESVSWVEVLP